MKRATPAYEPTNKYNIIFEKRFFGSASFFTAEMIVDAAVEVVRQSGFERINARTVSEQLHCSTQPVMYYFSTIDSLKRAAYRRTDHLHSEYMMNIPSGQDCRERLNPLVFLRRSWYFCDINFGGSGLKCVLH